MNESTFGLAGIDTTIVLLYLAGVLMIGTYFGRYVKNAGDFFVAGKTLPFWAIGMSIVVSDIGATDFIAVAGGTYRYGLSQANFDWIGSMPALVIAAFVFIPFYWRSGVYTVPEFLGRRYGTAVQTFMAVCWGLILVTNLGIMLYATSVLLRGVLGWDPALSIWVTTLVVGIYTIMGGLAAVVMTDVLQLVVMFIGGAALVVRALWEVGGPTALKQQIMEKGPAFQEHFDLYLEHDTATPFPWTGILFGLGIVLSTAYFAGNQGVVQRALGARSEWDAKAGVLLAGALKLFIPLLVAIPGLAAVALLPELPAADDAMPNLIRMLLPPGLRGLMFAAFIAALMSSVDSNLNSASTLWTQDVLRETQTSLERSRSHDPAKPETRPPDRHRAALVGGLDRARNRDSLLEHLQRDPEHLLSHPGPFAGDSGARHHLATRHGLGSARGSHDRCWVVRRLEPRFDEQRLPGRRTLPLHRLVVFRIHSGSHRSRESFHTARTSRAHSWPRLR